MDRQDSSVFPGCCARTASKNSRGVGGRRQPAQLFVIRRAIAALAGPVSSTGVGIPNRARSSAVPRMSANASGGPRTAGSSSRSSAFA